jgi:WXG100 family type VII secretion target
MAERERDGVLSVQPWEVIASANDIDQINMDIKEAFVRLKSKGDEVINGSWTGSAADKLDEGWQQWQEGIHKVVVALEQVTGLVMNAANTFHNTDQT